MIHTVTPLLLEVVLDHAVGLFKIDVREALDAVNFLDGKVVDTIGIRGAVCDGQREVGDLAQRRGRRGIALLDSIVSVLGTQYVPFS